MDSLKKILISDKDRLRENQTSQKLETTAIKWLEKDVLQNRTEIRRLERQKQKISDRLQKTKKVIEKIGIRLKTREGEISYRLREMYKIGRRGYLEAFFSYKAFTEIVKHRRYLSQVAKQDQKDYHTIWEGRGNKVNVLSLQKKKYNRQKNLLIRELVSQQSLKKHVSDRVQRLAKLQTNALKMDRTIQTNEKAIVKSTERIQKVLKEIQFQKETSLPFFDFESYRGRLPWPVNGPVLTRFGRYQDPDLKTWTVKRGLNILASQGSKVFVVAPGEVVMIDWYVGYGQFVLIRHPGGFFTLYGHLESVLVNLEEILFQGSVLGTVGSTGRLDGQSQLHFEILIGEEAKDPELWLKK